MVICRDQLLLFGAFTWRCAFDMRACLHKSAAGKLRSRDFRLVHTEESLVAES